MIWICVFILWCMTFLAHERLQPQTRKQAPLPTKLRCSAQTIRIIGPLTALLLCFQNDTPKAILFWLGLGACAGVCTSVVLAVQKQKQLPR